MSSTGGADEQLSSFRRGGRQVDAPPAELHHLLVRLKRSRSVCGRQQRVERQSPEIVGVLSGGRNLDRIQVMAGGDARHLWQPE